MRKKAALINQGILGSMIYLLYVNDFPYTIDSKIVMFADDIIMLA